MAETGTINLCSCIQKAINSGPGKLAEGWPLILHARDQSVPNMAYPLMHPRFYPHAVANLQEIGDYITRDNLQHTARFGRLAGEPPRRPSP